MIWKSNNAIFLFLFILCVPCFRIRFTLNIFYNTLICDKKVTLHVLFQIWPESQSACQPYSRVYLPRLSQMKSIAVPGECEGLRSVATLQSITSQHATGIHLPACTTVTPPSMHQCHSSACSCTMFNPTMFVWSQGVWLVCRLCNVKNSDNLVNHRSDNKIIRRTSDKSHEQTIPQASNRSTDHKEITDPEKNITDSTQPDNNRSDNQIITDQTSDNNKSDNR